MIIPTIDPEKCIGCGMCASICEEVFVVKGDKAVVKKNVDLVKNEDCIKDAIANCPNKAIS